MHGSTWDWARRLPGAYVADVGTRVIFRGIAYDGRINVYLRRGSDYVLVDVVTAPHYDMGDLLRYYADAHA